MGFGKYPIIFDSSFKQIKIMKNEKELMNQSQFDIISYIERIEEREEKKDFQIAGNLISSLLIGVILYILIKMNFFSAFIEIIFN